jgi:hypothetical protein
MAAKFVNKLIVSAATNYWQLIYIHVTNLNTKGHVTQNNYQMLEEIWKIKVIAWLLTVLLMSIWVAFFWDHPI